MAKFTTKNDYQRRGVAVPWHSGEKNKRKHYFNINDGNYYYKLTILAEN